MEEPEGQTEVVALLELVVLSPVQWLMAKAVQLVVIMLLKKWHQEVILGQVL